MKLYGMAMPLCQSTTFIHTAKFQQISNWFHLILHRFLWSENYKLGGSKYTNIDNNDDI